jgi:mono/diheme cytochrome c family protein
VKCHGLRGLGVDSTPEDQALDLNAKNDFGLPAAPMNLKSGLYRGGRRPIDLYRRMHAGIKGTPMPGQAGNLTSDEIWNVVDYVYLLGMPEKAE